MAKNDRSEKPPLYTLVLEGREVQSFTNQNLLFVGIAMLIFNTECSFHEYREDCFFVSL